MEVEGVSELSCRSRLTNVNSLCLLHLANSSICRLVSISIVPVVSWSIVIVISLVAPEVLSVSATKINHITLCMSSLCILCVSISNFQLWVTWLIQDFRWVKYYWIHLYVIIFTGGYYRICRRMN